MQRRLSAAGSLAYLYVWSIPVQDTLRSVDNVHPKAIAGATAAVVVQANEQKP